MESQKNEKKKIQNNKRKRNMIRKIKRLEREEKIASKVIDYFREEPSRVHKQDHLWDDLFVKPGDVLEWEALGSLPFVHHRLMYVGNNLVVHPDLPKSFPIQAQVVISNIHELHHYKEIFKMNLKINVPLPRYMCVMNALHSVGVYEYCPILSNCQHLVASWQGFKHMETIDGAKQVLLSILSAFILLLFLEYFSARVVFHFKKQIHSKPIFF